MPISDYISDQLRAQAAGLRGSIISQARWAFLGVAPQDVADHEARVEADRAARRVQAEQQQAAAVAEWDAFRAALPAGKAGAALLKVLDIHKPYLSDFGFKPVPMCEHCLEGGYDGDSVEWPCETYTTIRDVLNGE